MEHNGCKVMIAIADKSASPEIVRVCREGSALFSVIWGAKGTADPRILAELGIDGAERDAVISVVPAESAQELLLRLNEKFGFYMPGNGIAFTISMENIDDTLQSMLKRLSAEART